MLDIYLNWYTLFDEIKNIDVPEISTNKIVYTGMGGSYIPGKIAEILNLPLDYTVVSGIPRNLDKDTTLIAVSYSGTTKETIYAVNYGIKKESKIIVITSGGDLEKIAINKNIPLIKVKGLSQTRYSFPVLFTPLIKMLAKKANTRINIDELKEGIIESSDKMIKMSEDLEQKIENNLPVFYASRYFPLAIRFKQEINENAKYPAFYGLIPEVNHNEVESYVNGKYLIPIVIGDDDIDKVTIETLNALQISPLFKSELKNISSILLLAGLTSIRLANSLGENPEKLNIIPKARSLTANVFK
ncbi:bifunctional phosphoglucose/phosphomannose isomerase [Acidianus brierleyi]|uniref:Bifunctional phosphoglucose/phosphomannose isomerase n=1 Tax=Acidianus brierleyi TaxID=41673 RepID=A0A2U9IF98_9CREN|nr:bifunctional phosphoglucose/phosphomannose isomerase [Acidianus brierleyi]AWR94624.1 bifunctional phosphoglucose/phosphomannose isomerase [Acidianus brierleyi]